MNERILFIVTFQFFLTPLLLIISGEIGKRTLSRGYSSLTRAHRSGDFSFNLFYRVLYLPIALSGTAILLYIFKLDFLITNIWLVAIWHFLIQLILS